MFAKKISLALAAGAMMVGVAAAQGAWVEVNDNVIVPPFNVVADDVDDWDVYTAAGIEIGEVEDVVGTDANTPTALVVDFDGKEGYVDRDVVVPLDQFVRENNRLVLTADPAAVAQMEIWND